MDLVWEDNLINAGFGETGCGLDRNGTGYGLFL
jgi:hypothetical protein